MSEGGKMYGAKSMRARLLAGVLGAMSLSANAAVVALAPGEYDLTIETVLPHLEEALRYATTHTHRCLREPDATSMFPLLRHQAFAGCQLVPDADAGERVRFTLQCRNPQAASGSAAFAVGASHVSAVLEMKMGGKNMTLSQRLYGPRVGSCSASDDAPDQLTPTYESRIIRRESWMPPFPPTNRYERDRDRHGSLRGVSGTNAA